LLGDVRRATLLVVRRAAKIDARLAKLLRQASARAMSESARERQLVSLAYGNAKLENDRVTKPLVEDALRQPRPKR
jgi:hypothetical protein